MGDEIRVPFNVTYMFHVFDGNEILIHVQRKGGEAFCVVAEARVFFTMCPWNPRKRLRGENVLMVKRICYGNDKVSM